MTLYTLLKNERPEVLEKCRVKATEVMGSKTPERLLDEGLPKIYDELVEVLRVSVPGSSAQTLHQVAADTITKVSSQMNAQEAYRAGFTVSQLVHSYGSICQAITEYTHESDATVTSAEFSQLNFFLDVSIAQAVSEFEALTQESAVSAENLRLGSLAHELRNYLASAIMAHELIRRGGVGAAGATSSILTNAHQQMKDLIDRAIAEVRLGGHAPLETVRLKLIHVLAGVETAALLEAGAKGICIRVDADPDLEVDADAHLLASAFANLVQNAIKFTNVEGNVWIRAFEEETDAVIEIEDQCGGLPEGMPDKLFEAFVKNGKDRSGMGLGLSIARRAVERNRGHLSVLDKPGHGCIFTVRLPIAR